MYVTVCIFDWSTSDQSPTPVSTNLDTHKRVFRTHKNSDYNEYKLVLLKLVWKLKFLKNT